MPDPTNTILWQLLRQRRENEILAQEQQAAGLAALERAQGRQDIEFQQRQAMNREFAKQQGAFAASQERPIPTFGGEEYTRLAELGAQAQQMEMAKEARAAALRKAQMDLQERIATGAQAGQTTRANISKEAGVARARAPYDARVEKIQELVAGGMPFDKALSEVALKFKPVPSGPGQKLAARDRVLANITRAASQFSGNKKVGDILQMDVNTLKFKTPEDIQLVINAYETGMAALSDQGDSPELLATLEAQRQRLITRFNKKDLGGPSAEPPRGGAFSMSPLQQMTK